MKENYVEKLACSLKIFCYTGTIKEKASVTVVWPF